jgi:flavin reductase (DIM6/NTAB) family NADH-FMN oxidoreductase RutF
METLTPGPEQARAFRSALGHYATGVTIVTTQGPDGPVGMTANSFTALSLDPPLVLWCPAKRSSRFSVLAEAQFFSIHVLSADQLELCLRVARSGSDFEGIELTTSPEGAPVLPGVLARFDCEGFDQHDGGDHAIVVGRVLRASFRPGAPLIFWGGLYGDFLKHE